MMRIITNPTKSVGSNTASVHATAEIVAITGSLVPSMVARIEPTRTTPAMYSQNAPNVPPTSKPANKYGSSYKYPIMITNNLQE